MKNKSKFGKYVVGFQGLYYIVTGLWALISIESFNKIISHAHEGPAFEMHSIAAMALVLGLYYIYSVKDKNWFKTRKDIIYLVIGINLSIILVELIYFSAITGTLFLFDLIEEIIITILLLWIIKK